VKRKGNYHFEPKDRQKILQMLKVHLEAGRPPKAFVMDHGMSIAWVYRVWREMGYRVAYLSEDERKLVENFRRSRSAT
jgi:hypothetical protein